MVDPEAFVAEKIDEIDDAVGDGHAVIALSGGVDSSTAAALAYEALGDRLTPVYVDTGLMRKGETEGVRETFDYMERLRIVDARERFLDALSGVTDPEEKRHAIGERFIREFETVAREVDADHLVQGTIYPDRIESEGTIKSHHNVGGLPERVDFDGIVEPMRDLYKDEVREVARELDLESKGDNRVHGWVVSVRSVESRDGMTARAQEIDWETLQRIQSRITGARDDVSRVVYDVTHKPPATIEYE
ncbi:glutamine-hydrolyzing GMP synthase subunit GuaA [Halobacteriales archaeon QS_9_70_65]|nr:MAG: glutamine-hydrolyzing GMP synthase subunit GuaA [Halobacteriales archaeon QS_9_70_65]